MGFKATVFKWWKLSKSYVERFHEDKVENSEYYWSDASVYLSV